MFLKKILSTISLCALVMVFSVGDVSAATSVGNLNLSAKVVGLKPVVTNVNPSAVFNNVTPTITITGYNFTGALYVTLDDENSSMLTGVIIDTDNQIRADMPLGVAPGIYNVHVTTANGTNLTSDVKLTVNAPAAAANATIVSTTPAGPIVIAGLTQNFSVVVSDINDEPVVWSATSVTSAGGLGSFVAPAGSVTTALPNHEATFTTNFSATTNGVYLGTFKADEDGSLIDGGEDVKILTIYAISW